MDQRKHFEQSPGSIWFGGSFAHFKFSTFLRIVETSGCAGRIWLDWEENNNGVLEYGLATIIFSRSNFTNAFFKTSYLSVDQLEKLPAMEAILCRVWSIGTDYNIKGNYSFECNHQTASLYEPDFILNSRAINEMVTELQEASINY